MTNYNITIKAKVNNVVNIKEYAKDIIKFLEESFPSVKTENIDYERILSEDDRVIYNMAIKDAAGYIKEYLMEYKNPLGIEFLNSMVEDMKKDCIKF